MAGHRMKSWVCIIVLAGMMFGVYLVYIGTKPVQAQTAEELQQKIDKRTSDIKGLQQEIAAYQKQLDTLGSQANTLAATVKSLEITQKKLAADIRLTETRIASKNDDIAALGRQIRSKKGSIDDDKRIIARTLVSIEASGDPTIPRLILGADTVAEAWDAIDRLVDVQKSLQERIGSLMRDAAQLETNRSAVEKAKADLIKLQSELTDQRKVTLSTAAEKTSLLTETHQSEAAYRKLVAEKQALQAAFEREVLDYESELKLSVDVSKLPHTGSGVLSWPLDNVKITQYFGNTPFASANPQVYNGRGHTGVDFRATIGTPVRAALNGKVSGVGNTDLIRGCYSYGKWVMVRHPNGLSTLYAHLSLPTVAVGEEVATGQLVGYSGNTGYTTGPHLHFGVYATQGVEITALASSKNCRGAVIPLADFKAYLNPLSYL